MFLLASVAPVAPVQAAGDDVIRLASPQAGDAVSANERLVIETELASDATAADVNGVTFLLDGEMIFGGQDWSYPFSRAIDPSDLAEGDHVVSIRAQLSDGNQVFDDAAISVVTPSTTSGTTSSTSTTSSPVVIDFPADGATLPLGEDVTIATAVTDGLDASDVNGVTFLLDGAMIFGGQDWSYPFSRPIQAEDISEGSHEIVIEAQLVDGTSVTDAVQVTVGDADAGPVTISSPSAGDTFAGDDTVTIATEVDSGVDVSGVEFRLDGDMIFGGQDWSEPFSRSVDLTGVSMGTHTVGIVARTASGEEVRDSVDIEVTDQVADGTSSDDSTDTSGDTSDNTDSTDDTASSDDVADVTTCVADVTWGPGGDFDPENGERLTDAFGATPDGGTLGILPGVHEYDTQTTFIWARLGGASKKICGTGEKPTIKGPSNTNWSFGSYSELTLTNLKIDTIAINQGDHELEHLRLHDVDLSNAPSECLMIGWAPQLNEGPGQRESDPLTDSFVTLTDVSFSNCASPAQDDHALYLDRRGCVFRASNIHFEHLGNLEGFRSLCRVNIVTDSFFTNIVRNDDGTLKSAPNGREHGGAPIDLAACSAYILENNEFDVYGNGSVSAIAPRQRRSISSCDVPNWSPESDGGKFWDRDFWAEVNAKPITDPSNPHIFPLFLTNNTIRYTYTGGTVNRSTAVIDFGTYPRQLDRTQTCCSRYREVPQDDPATPANDGWVERSVTFSANNSYVGDWWKIFRGGGNLGLPPTDSTDPDALTPPSLPPRSFVQVGGDDLPGASEADIALPDWWPHSCEDLTSTYDAWWDEPGDHSGTPPCSF